MFETKLAFIFQKVYPALIAAIAKTETAIPNQLITDNFSLNIR